MTIAVVILNWNGLEDTCECLEAVLAMEHEDFRVIVTDNGSKEDEASQLSERFGSDQRLIVRRNEQNLGFTRGVNREVMSLLDDPTIEFVALLNNDAIPGPRWLSELEAAARSGARIVASRMVRYDDPGQIDNAGHVLLTTGEILPRGTGRSAEEFDRPAWLVGACGGAMLVETALLREIGCFDPYFVTGYEDAEFGLRAFVAGFATRYCPAAVVRHKVSRSVDRIRDFAFAVKLQQDINYTWVKLTPGGALWLDVPLVLARTLAVLLTSALLLRWRLFRVQWTALRASLKEQARLRTERRGARSLRRIGALRFVRARSFFLGHYLRYFARYVIGRRKTVFER